MLQQSDTAATTGGGGNLETTANAVADSDWASAEFFGVKFWFYENLL